MRTYENSIFKSLNRICDEKVKIVIGCFESIQFYLNVVSLKSVDFSLREKSRLNAFENTRCEVAALHGKQRLVQRK